jgi:hypothetical protein
MRPIWLRQYLQRFRNLIQKKPSFTLAQYPLIFNHIEQALSYKIKVQADFIEITTPLKPCSFYHSLRVDDTKWLTLDLFKLLLELVELWRRVKG